MCGGRGVASYGGGAPWDRALCMCDGRNRGDTNQDSDGHRALTGLCGEVRTNGGKCRYGGWVMVVRAAGCA